MSVEGECNLVGLLHRGKRSYFGESERVIYSNWKIRVQSIKSWEKNWTEELRLQRGLHEKDRIVWKCIQNGFGKYYVINICKERVEKKGDE